MLPNYEIDRFGVIHQIEYTPTIYDQEYLSYYHGKSERTIKLGYQRMGWLLGLLRRMPESVLEIGYGTGSFIEAAQVSGVPNCVGCEITKFPLPDGVRFLSWPQALQERWDLAAMFDVLEHIPDLTFLENLNTKYLAIAVPYCRWRELNEQGDDWMRKWRMLLPNEHLHHFDPASLNALLSHYGFECVTQNTFEDGMRMRTSETGPNILSGFYKKAGV